MERWTGIEIERIYVDKGYQGHDYPNKFKVYKSGQKRGITVFIDQAEEGCAEGPIGRVIARASGDPIPAAPF